MADGSDSGTLCFVIFRVLIEEKIRNISRAVATREISPVNVGMGPLSQVVAQRQAAAKLSRYTGIKNHRCKKRCQ